MSPRRPGRAWCVLGATAVVLAGAGAGTAAAAPVPAAPVRAAPVRAAMTPASETSGTCGTTLSAYGHRLSCLRGSFYDRIRVGSIDDTFAIRSDRAIVYTRANFGWSRISTGLADDIKWVDGTRNGLEGVCVETSSGHLYYSVYDRQRGWQKFTAGCEAG